MKIYLKIFFVSFLFLCQSAHAWSIAEFYYSLNPYSVLPLATGSNPVVNNGGATHPTNGGYFLANYLVPNGWSFKPLSPNYWSGANWTGLEPADRSDKSQQGVASTGNMPSYGNSVVQLEGQNIGMQLNTWGLKRPDPQITTASLQFATQFPPGRKPWTNPDSQLCMNAIVDLHSWYGNGVQALMTVQFRNSNNANDFFFINVHMLDTDPGNSLKDEIQFDNPADTGGPIAHTFTQTNNAQNPLIKYSSPIPGYGAMLGQYSKTPSKSAGGASNPTHYGFCTSNAQFTTLLKDINVFIKKYNANEMTKTNPRLHALFSSENPSDYQLVSALISPEIAGEGNAGLSVSAMNVYRMLP